MRPFGNTSGSLRAFAACVSLALTAAIFMLLRAASTTPPPKAAERQVAVAVLAPRAVPRPAPRPTTPETTVVPAARSSVRRAAPVRAPATAPAAAAVAESGPATAPSGLAAAPSRESEAASAPLRIDAAAIRRAIAGSESPVRQMARRSGVELDSPRPSRSEALAETVAETGVPDCLAPNAAGSLLSVPILLMLAVQGKCR